MREQGAQDRNPIAPPCQNGTDAIIPFAGAGQRRRLFRILDILTVLWVTGDIPEECRFLAALGRELERRLSAVEQCAGLEQRARCFRSAREFVHKMQARLGPMEGIEEELQRLQYSYGQCKAGFTGDDDSGGDDDRSGERLRRQRLPTTAAATTAAVTATAVTTAAVTTAADAAAAVRTTAVIISAVTATAATTAAAMTSAASWAPVPQFLSRLHGDSGGDDNCQHWHMQGGFLFGETSVLRDLQRSQAHLVLAPHWQEHSRVHTAQEGHT